MSDTPPLNASVLEQWALFGGHWRVMEISEVRATVELCACTGEPIQRLHSENPETIAYLREAGAGARG